MSETKNTFKNLSSSIVELEQLDRKMASMTTENKLIEMPSKLKSIDATVARHEEEARECTVSIDLSVANSAAVLEAFEVGIAHLNAAEIHQLEIVVARIQEQLVG